MTSGTPAAVVPVPRYGEGALSDLLPRQLAERLPAGTALWFGPVAESLLPRIGDVLAAARGAGAVVATTTEPAESGLVGMHGSMTPAEQLVPLLEVRA